MVSELPARWTTVAIGEICSQGQQRIPAPDERFVYIDIASVDRVRKIISEPQVLLGSDAPSRARKVVANGDLIVSMTRPNLNAVAMIDAEFDGAIASTGFDVLRPDGVEPRWIFAAVKSANFVTAMSAKVQGALYPAIKSVDIKDFEIPLPPLNEQKRIAQKLDALLAQVDTLKARIDAIPALLKRFRHATLSAAANGDLTKDWREVIQGTQDRESANQYLARILEARSLRPRTKFKPPVAPDTDTRSTEVPNTWVVSSVSSFAECLDSMRVPVKKELRAREGGIYPYFGANGEVDRVNEFLFDDDLVLVTEDETFYGRVKPIAYKYSGKCWVNNHVHVLRAHDKVGQSFLCYILMHYDVTPWLTGTTGRAKLTQGALMALPIGVPPPDEQAEIVRRIEKLFAFADQLEARVSAARVRIDALTQSLLGKAFRGELVPQDPDDEPASVLLERIRAQRAAAPKPKRGRKATVN